MKKKLNYSLFLELAMYLATAAYVIYGLIEGKYGYVANGILTIIVILAPRVIMKIFKFNGTNFINFLVQFFIFVSMFLGKLNGFYVKISNWDTFLHVTSGFIIFLVAYIVFIVQNNYQVKNVNPVLVVTYCVLFAIAMTALWEIWEFVGDSLLGLDSQGGSLFDTMKDIITGSIGPIVLFPFLLSNLKGKKNILFDDIVNVVTKKNN